MRTRENSEKIANFCLGHSVQGSVINAFEWGLEYTAINTGIENSFGPIKKYLRSLSNKSNDCETLNNLNSIRKDPDVLLISPAGKTIQLEIKTRSISSFDKFISNNFNKNEIINVMKYHKRVRFLYVDLYKRRIASISAFEPMTQEAQYNNWYHPETWIDGLSNRAELIAWQEEYIFTPLMIQSEKIISRLGNEIYET